MTAVGMWEVAYAPYTTEGRKWVIVKNHKGIERIWIITQAFSQRFSEDPDSALEQMWDSPWSFDLDWSVFEDEDQDEREYMARLFVQSEIVSANYLGIKPPSGAVPVRVESIEK